MGHLVPLPETLLVLGCHDNGTVCVRLAVPETPADRPAALEVIAGIVNAAMSALADGELCEVWTVPPADLGGTDARLRASAPLLDGALPEADTYRLQRLPAVGQTWMVRESGRGRNRGQGGWGGECFVCSWMVHHRSDRRQARSSLVRHLVQKHAVGEVWFDRNLVRLSD